MLIIMSFVFVSHITAIKVNVSTIYAECAPSFLTEFCICTVPGLPCTELALLSHNFKSCAHSEQLSWIVHVTDKKSKEDVLGANPGHRKQRPH